MTGGIFYLGGKMDFDKLREELIVRWREYKRWGNMEKMRCLECFDDQPGMICPRWDACKEGNLFFAPKIGQPDPESTYGPKSLWRGPDGDVYILCQHEQYVSEYMMDNLSRGCASDSEMFSGALTKSAIQNVWPGFEPIDGGCLVVGGRGTKTDAELI